MCSQEGGWPVWVAATIAADNSGYSACTHACACVVGARMARRAKVLGDLRLLFFTLLHLSRPVSSHIFRHHEPRPRANPVFALQLSCRLIATTLPQLTSTTAAAATVSTVLPGRPGSVGQSSCAGSSRPTPCCLPEYFKVVTMARSLTTASHACTLYTLP